MSNDASVTRIITVKSIKMSKKLWDLLMILLLWEDIENKNFSMLYITNPIAGWDFRGQGGKNLARKPWTLRQSFEQKSRTFVAILRYDQKSHAFVAILYPRDEILEKYPALETNFG